MKRFYEEVGVIPVDSGWQVELDGRGIKTQGGRRQIVPSKILADALAAEWSDQSAEIDSDRFLFRDHADFAIDIIGTQREKAIDKLLGFADTDTLCYRADPEDALYRRQLETWEPLLEHLEKRLGLRFQRVSGVMHKPQLPETLATLRRHLETQDDFSLAALTAMASLAGSLSVALLAGDEEINDPLLLWDHANLEEEWQAEQWGREDEAEARRKLRREEFSTAQVFQMLAAER